MEEEIEYIIEYKGRKAIVRVVPGKPWLVTIPRMLLNDLVNDGVFKLLTMLKDDLEVVNHG